MAELMNNDCALSTIYDRALVMVYWFDKLCDVCRIGYSYAHSKNTRNKCGLYMQKYESFRDLCSHKIFSQILVAAESSQMLYIQYERLKEITVTYRVWVSRRDYNCVCCWSLSMFYNLCLNYILIDLISHKMTEVKCLDFLYSQTINQNAHILWNFPSWHDQAREMNTILLE